MTVTRPTPGLNGNQLKLIALVVMTLDHIGSHLLPQILLLRIIGRLAFPIFAWMIAEGCHYTKNRRRYLLTMVGLAALCRVAYFVAQRSLYQCVLVTFSLSIGLIYLLDRARRAPSFLSWLLFLLSVAGIYCLTELVPLKLPGFHVDYRFLGVMLPVLIYLGRDRWQKLALAAAGLLLLSLDIGYIQWFCLAALPLLALYNGTRGKGQLKYLFYIYYPAHLLVIELIRMLARAL